MRRRSSFCLWKERKDRGIREREVATVQSKGRTPYVREKRKKGGAVICPRHQGEATTHFIDEKRKKREGY